MPIIGIGTVVVDHVAELSEFPDVDTKSEVTNDWRQVGGPVPVALSTAAFYGSTTTFCGRWANDAHGAYIQKTLEGRSVTLVRGDPKADWATGFAQVWVDRSSGSRTIAYSRGRFPVPNKAFSDAIDFEQQTILHLDGWAAEAAIPAAKIVKSNGGTVVLDAGSVKPGLDKLLPFVDVLIASQLFQQSHFGTDTASTEQLLQLGPESIITTSGAGGSRWLTNEWSHSEPASKIQPVDTNGAGDVFAGAVLNAIECGLERPETLKFANRVAGYCCEHRGNHSLPPISVKISVD